MISTSSAISYAVSTIVSPSFVFGLCTPGVSIKIIWEFSLLTIALIAVLVVCDLFTVIATFSPTNLFISVDLPTLVLPIIAKILI